MRKFFITMGVVLAGSAWAIDLASGRQGAVLRDAKGGFDVVSIGAGDQAPYAAYGSWVGGLANALFVERKSNQAKLLLDKPAYIKRFQRVELPEGRSMYLFSAAFEDGNRDGKIDAEDPCGLYGAARDGSSYWSIAVEAADDWDIESAQGDSRVYARQAQRNRKASFSSASERQNGLLYLLSKDLRKASLVIDAKLAEDLKALEAASGRR